jgi:hypothetical protein
VCLFITSVCSTYYKAVSERGGEGYCVKEGGGEEGECVCVYYCSTFDKAVRVGGGGEWEDVCLLLQYRILLRP